MTIEQRIKRTGRVDWVDMAKGIAILLVIVGHTDYSILRHFIFSFHMPLFFILSGYTFRCSKSVEELGIKTKKAFRHLVVPGVVLVIAIKFLNFFINDHDGSLLQYILQSLISLLFYSGVEAQFAGHTINGIGVAWFFVAFFLSRTLYDYLHLKLGRGARLAVVIILTLVGVIVTKWTWLPLSLDISLAALVFIETGHQLANSKRYETYDTKRLIVNTICWWVGVLMILYISHNSLGMAVRRYPLFPLCYVIAFIGTFAICDISKLLVKTDWIRKPICTIGEFSFDLLCVHILDVLWMPFLEQSVHNTILLTTVRVLLDISLSFIYLLIRKKTFKYYDTKI